MLSPRGTCSSIAALVVALTPVASATPARNGLPTVFAPVHNSGDSEFSLFALDLDGLGGTVDFAFDEFGASSPTAFQLSLDGTPVTPIDVPEIDQGWVFVSPPSNLHFVGFNSHGDTSFAPAKHFDDTPVDTCQAPFFADDFDFFTLNLDVLPVDTTLCGDMSDGSFIGCSSVNDVPAQGAGSTPVETGIGSCQGAPCMGRVFPERAVPVGCLSAVNAALGMLVYEGIGSGLGNDTLFVYGDEVTLANNSSTAGSGEFFTIGNPAVTFEFDLPAFGTTTAGPLDSSEPWHQVIFADGFESGNTASWSTSSGAPRDSGRRVGATDGFRGISAEDGGNSRAAVVFPINTAAVSAQLGAVNMGKKRAKLTITYRDAGGTKLGAKKRLTLKSNAYVELDLPGKLRDLEGTYADIKIKGKKSAVWPYARIEHDGSGDVTIVPGVVIG